MINSCVKSLVSGIENFVSSSDTERFGNGPNGMMSMTPYKGDNFLVVFISFLIVVLIVSLVGQFLWNYVMSGENALIKGCNKAKDIWQILALYILFSLFFGR